MLEKPQKVLPKRPERVGRKVRRRGGVGLVACCDIVFAVQGASFALTETRLGLIPATIGPYVVAAIGERAARRYFLTAEAFTAAEAHRIGLVHEICKADQLPILVSQLIDTLVACGPNALTAAKDLIWRVGILDVRTHVWIDLQRRLMHERNVRIDFADATGSSARTIQWARCDRRPSTWMTQPVTARKVFEVISRYFLLRR